MITTPPKTNIVVAIIALISFAAILVSKAFDFNHDGNHDYIIHNQSTRQTAAWFLNNKYQYIGGRYGPTLPPGWDIVAVADFNRDGQSDLLLFNPSTRQGAVWYLNRGRLIASSYITVNAASSWTPVAVTDFNRNGYPDIVVYNTSGATSIWNMVGARFIDDARGPTLPGGYFLISAQEDFNNDGNPDYLLLNPVSGGTVIWYLNGRSFAGAVRGPTIPKGYTVDSLADFNHDGSADYLLSMDRVTAIWFLRGNIFLGGVHGPTIAQGWHMAFNCNRPCIFSVFPKSFAYDYHTHLGSVGASVFGNNCDWQAQSLDYWIHISRGGPFTGSDTAWFSVDQNNTSSPRTGSIAVAGQIVTINQEAQAQHQCNDTQVAGGNNFYSSTFDLGKTRGAFGFSYDTYTIEDQIQIFYQGRKIFDTGCVGAAGNYRISYSGTSSQITVQVSPNCAGNGSSTQWTFTVGCP